MVADGVKMTVMLHIPRHITLKDAQGGNVMKSAITVTTRLDRQYINTEVDMESKHTCEHNEQVTEGPVRRHEHPASARQGNEGRMGVRKKHIIKIYIKGVSNDKTN